MERIEIEMKRAEIRKYLIKKDRLDSWNEAQKEAYKKYNPKFFDFMFETKKIKLYHEYLNKKSIEIFEKKYEKELNLYALGEKSE